MLKLLQYIFAISVTSSCIFNKFILCLLLFFTGVNWALIRCTTPPEVPRPFEPGTSLSSSSTLSDDKSVIKGAKGAGQDTLSTSSNPVPVHSESSLKAGEKSNSNRSATKSTQSSGGSYLDFDFF
jgi:hypothetical protein